jgi:hypothetical protein
MIIRKTAERLAQTKFIREALEDPVDLKDIWKQPSARMIIGLWLVAFSYIIGWPAVAVLGILSVYLREPLIVAVGGPVTYGFSHLVFLVGAWLAGAQHARLLMRYATKVIFRKILHNSKKSATSDVHPTSNNHS